MTRLLGVFAKYWTPGQVKTRLAAALGQEAAARLYAAFLRTTLSRFRHCGDRRVVVFSPSDRRGEFKALCSGDWELAPQSTGDLGDRMHRFFADAFAKGASRIVLIGSDSPTLPAEYIDRAFDLLADSPVVLGPTTDGGYYLVGISGQIPPIFEGIAWSTPQVWRQTAERLAVAQLRYDILPQWYDVDESADLERLREEVERLVDSSEEYRRLYDELQRETSEGE
ncbi:MAG: TIGR04282 family arsenosugar biosynthesis glycosyltransferase [Planctomycetes bacterium]|nr:TIGR04282 family arsenosugar biosynthesis glycosyltransferase [Planctomycetota bacterium]